MTFARLTPLLLCIACAAPGTNDDLTVGGREPLAPTVRDSAGVTLYEHAADAMARAPHFELSKRPVTELKGEDLEVDLTRVIQPLLFADGRMAVFAEGSVLIVGAEGVIAERIGREGSGPGEFRDDTLTRGLGDTVLVQDDQNARVSFVVPGSGVVRSRTFRGSMPHGVFGVIGQFGDDALLVGTDGFSFTPEFARNPVVWWRSARLDHGADSMVLLDSVPGPELRGTLASPDIVEFTPIPVTVAWGEEFLVSAAAHWGLLRMGPDGIVSARISVAAPRRAVDAASLQAYQQARFEAIVEGFASGRAERRVEGSAVDTAFVRKRIHESPRADSLPLIAKALVGPDGIAWIKDGGYPYTEPTWAWTAVTKDGTILGRLVGNGKDPVVAFGTNSVMLRSEDDDGFVTFRVHSLRISAAP